MFGTIYKIGDYNTCFRWHIDTDPYWKFNEKPCKRATIAIRGWREAWRPDWLISAIYRRGVKLGGPMKYTTWNGTLIITVYCASPDRAYHVETTPPKFIYFIYLFYLKGLPKGIHQNVLILHTNIRPRSHGEKSLEI